MTSTDPSQSVYVTIIMTPKPGKLEELYNFATAGAEHHEKNAPHCLSWVATKAMDIMKLLQGVSEEDALEGQLIVHQEWTSLKEFMEHGKTDHSAKTREQLLLLISEQPVLKVGHKFAGFTSR